MEKSSSTDGGEPSNGTSSDTTSGTCGQDNVTLGCGSQNSSDQLVSSIQGTSVRTPTPHLPITLHISTTTGGNFSISLENHNTVDILKKVIAKKLKVAKERICLLHRERELQDGSLRDNGLIDGSKIVLIPSVETGLLAQRPENTVMQALESLNDTQVSDFLSGKTPLNLSMRLGDHMMLIQLQLSTVNPSSSSQNVSNVSGSSSWVNNSGHASNKTISCSNGRQKGGTGIEIRKDVRSTGTSSSIGSGSQIMRAGTAIKKPDPKRTWSETNGSCNQLNYLLPLNVDSEQQINNGNNSNNSDVQSPITSLSNLVSSPIKTIPIKGFPITEYPVERMDIEPATPDLDCSDPIAAKLTSCLCKTLCNPKSVAPITQMSNDSGNCSLNEQRPKSPIPPYQPKVDESFTALEAISDSKSNEKSTSTNVSNSILHKTINNPIVKFKHRNNIHFNPLRRSKSSENLHLVSMSPIKQSGNEETTVKTESAGPENQPSTSTGSDTKSVTGLNTSDTRTLAEASRSLTQTLRKLSKEVFTNKMEIADSKKHKHGKSYTNDFGNRSSTVSGAVIESMKNHGKGIYSGTFSGTLNPALQDRHGRPKRDISTVIHILNDLLSATPQYSRATRISFEPANRPIKQSVSRQQTTTSVQTLNKLSTQEYCSVCSANVSQSSNFSASICPFPNCKSTIIGDSIYCPQHNINNTTGTSSETIGNDQENNLNSSVVCKPIVSTLPPFILDKSIESTELDDEPTVVPISSLANTPPDTPPGARGDNVTCVRHRFPIVDNVLRSDIICAKCSLIEMENSKTRSKVNHLRFVMQQKKERREARKLKCTPYGGRIVGSTSSCANKNHLSATEIANLVGTLGSTGSNTTLTTSSGNNCESNTTNGTTLTPLSSPNDVGTTPIIEDTFA